MNAVEVFQAAADAFNAGDQERFRALMHPDVVFTPDPSWPEAGPFHGRDAYLAFIADFAAPFSSVTLAVDDPQEVRGWAVLRSRWVVEGAASGIATDVEFTFVGRVSEGQIVQIAAFFDHQAALASVP